MLDNETNEVGLFHLYNGRRDAHTYRLRLIRAVGYAMTVSFVGDMVWMGLLQALLIQCVIDHLAPVVDVSRRWQERQQQQQGTCLQRRAPAPSETDHHIKHGINYPRPSASRQRAIWPTLVKYSAGHCTNFASAWLAPSSSSYGARAAP